ncbi:MAG: sugar phosphate isomerase/epimerase family protein [Acidimicrobiia bacterium]
MDVGLIASAYTLSGSIVGAGVGGPARWSFAERIKAAQEAGYTGVGVFEADYAAMRKGGLSDRDLLQILADHNMTVQEIEFLFDWCYDDDRADSSKPIRENLFHMAEVFRPHHLSCGDVNRPSALPPLPIVADRFGEICDRVAQLDVSVVLEFLPWTGIPDLSTAHEIVRMAERPNGGIMLDAWHYFRGPSHLGQLQSIDSSEILAIALCDADPPTGDPVEDTTRRRLLPGHGEFDLVGLLNTLRRLEVDVPISVEILSEEQASLSADEAARRSYSAAMEVLGQAGYRTGSSA